MDLPLSVWALSTITAIVVPLFYFTVMGFFSGNQFDVKGKVRTTQGYLELYINFLADNSQRVLITGGSQGMGRSVARLLASKGASVIIVARTVSRLEEAVEHASVSHPVFHLNWNTNPINVERTH